MIKKVIRYSTAILFCSLSLVVLLNKTFAYPCETAVNKQTCDGYIGQCGGPGCPSGSICTNPYNYGCVCQSAGSGVCSTPICGQGSTDGKCNEDGGCSERQRCVNGSCTTDNTCSGSVGNCNSSHIGDCGPEAGCPEGKQCLTTNGTYYCGGNCSCATNGQSCSNKACCPSYFCDSSTKKCRQREAGDTIVQKNSIKDLIYSGPRITNFLQIITPVAKALYYGGIFIGFCFIVYAGYALMTSEGNPQRTQDAQEQLTAAILGIMFILLSAAILRVIINSLIGGNIGI